MHSGVLKSGGWRCCWWYLEIVSNTGVLYHCCHSGTPKGEELQLVFATGVYFVQVQVEAPRRLTCVRYIYVLRLVVSITSNTWHQRHRSFVFHSLPEFTLHKCKLKREEGQFFSFSCILMRCVAYNVSRNVRRGTKSLRGESQSC